MGKKRQRGGFNNPFASLPPLVEKVEPAAPASAPVARPTETSTPDDAALFHRAVGEVRPLRGERPQRVAPPKVLDPYVDNDDARVVEELRNLVQGQAEFRVEDTGEVQWGLADGVSSKTLATLRRGGFSYHRHVDLHGLTREEAHQTLVEFITRARADGERCVLVITGRGLHTPGGVSVLRESLPRWLTRAPLGAQVLAYCTARLSDGGPGASYVLLRRQGGRSP